MTKLNYTIKPILLSVSIWYLIATRWMTQELQYIWCQLLIYHQKNNNYNDNDKNNNDDNNNNDDDDDYNKITNWQWQ